MRWSWRRRKKKKTIQILLLGVENKSTSLESQEMWCRYVYVNNSGWSKSSSEGDRYFYELCFIWGRKMAPVYVVWMRAGAVGEGMFVVCVVKEKGHRKCVKGGIKWANRENWVKKKRPERTTEVWKGGQRVIDGGRRNKKWRDDAVERKEDDTNGFWTRCIQLLRITWIKHGLEQSSRTGYGASR